MIIADALDIPDKASSVVGAIAGVASLVIAVRDRPARADVLRDRRRRSWLYAAVSSAAVLAIAFAVRPVRLLSPWLSPVAGIAAAMATTAFLVIYLLSARPRLEPLMRQVLTLLEEYAVQHRHNFGGEHVPALDKIYVAQRASSMTASRVRRSLGEMLAVEANALVVGGPGAGKSSMVMHVAYEGARAWRAGAPGDRSPFRGAIPMVAAVGSLAENGVAASLADFCRTELGVDVPREFFERPPGPRRRWLVLVDGLDEVLDQDRRSRLLRRLDAVVDEPGSPYRFLIATRPLDHAELAELRGRRIGDYELHTFREADIEEFTAKWFRARNPEGTDAAEAGAAFLSRVREAELEPVVHIPLLVTIAALVHERDRGAALPTSRGGLYAQFVENLLRSRADLRVAPESVLAATGSRERAGRRLLDWLAADLPDLLERVAYARLWERDGRDPTDIATELSRTLSGASPDGIDGWWRGRVRDALFASGVLTRQAGGTTFVHQSLGEYLAAGPLLRASTIEQQLAWLDQPSTRSTALFAIARGGVPLDPVVAGLLAAGEVRRAAYLLIEGLAMTRENATAIVAGLLGRVERGTADALDCVTLIEPILARPRLRPVVFDFAADPARDPWARASVCDSLANTFPERISPVIRALARDPDAPPAVRRWMATRLAALGDASEDLLARIRWPDEDSDPSGVDHHRLLIRNARQAAARDSRRTGQERITAARALLADGDPLGRDTLTEIAGFGREPVDRQLALFVLLDAGETVDAGVVAELFELPGWTFGVRLRLMQALAETNTPPGWSALRRALTDPATPDTERAVATQLIAGSRHESAVTVQLALIGDAGLDVTTRLEVAAGLAERGNATAVRLLTTTALDHKAGTLARWTAFEALRALPDHDRAAPLLRDVLRRTRSEDQREDWAVSLIGSYDDLAYEVLAPFAVGDGVDARRRTLAVAQLMKIDTDDSARALRSVVERAANPHALRVAAFLALGRGHPGRGELDRLLPLLAAPIRTFMMLAMLMTQAIELKVPGLTAAVRAMSTDAEATDESRAAAAFGLAMIGTTADLEPLVGVALDPRNRAEVRVWAVQWILTVDPGLGLELVEALIEPPPVPEGAQHFLLRLAAGIGDGHAVEKFARSRSVAPSCRLDALYLLTDASEASGADVADALAELVVEGGLALSQRIEAARLLAARRGDAAGLRGRQLGTSEGLEIACRGYALLAAVANDRTDASWLRSASRVLIEPECPGDARRHIIDHLGSMDLTAARDLLAELGASAKVGWDARAYAGLNLLPRWPAEAVVILRAVPAERVPEWLYDLVRDALGKYGAHA